MIRGRGTDHYTLDGVGGIPKSDQGGVKKKQKSEQKGEKSEQKDKKPEQVV